MVADSSSLTWHMRDECGWQAAANWSPQVRSEPHNMQPVGGAISSSPGSDAAIRVIDKIWNDDDDALLLHVRQSCRTAEDYPGRLQENGPFWFRDLVHAYKALVPDLHLSAEVRESHGNVSLLVWTARGRHSGVLAGVAPSLRHIELQGTVRVDLGPEGGPRILHGTWDTAHLLQQIGITVERFEPCVRLSPTDVRLRATFGAEGPSLLLFPTFSLPGWLTWRRFLDVFRKTRSVISFEAIATRRGFERLRVPPWYGVRAETDGLVRALRAARTWGPFDVIGHSAGAALALDYAVRNPASVRSLTLVEPSLAWLLRQQGRLTSASRRFIRERLRAYRTPMTATRYARFLRHSYMEKDYEPTASPRWHLMRAYMHNMPYRSALYGHINDVGQLAVLRCPVLLIRGRESDAFHNVVIAELAKALPQALVVELPGGHVPHFGAGFQPFMDIVTRFQHAAGEFGGRVGDAA